MLTNNYFHLILDCLFDRLGHIGMLGMGNFTLVFFEFLLLVSLPILLIMLTGQANQTTNIK